MLTDLLFWSDFKDKKAGHVINIGSIAGREPYAGGSIYTATKHAVNAFTGSLMRELVDTPIRVTEIQPGKIYFYWLNCDEKLRDLPSTTKAWSRPSFPSYDLGMTRSKLTRFIRVCNRVCFNPYLLGHSSEDLVTSHCRRHR